MGVHDGIDGRYFPFPVGRAPKALWRCPNCGLTTLEEHLATAPGPRPCPKHRRQTEENFDMERFDLFVSPGKAATEFVEEKIRWFVDEWLDDPATGVETIGSWEELRTLCRMFRLSINLIARDVGTNYELKRLAELVTDWDFS